MAGLSLNQRLQFSRFIHGEASSLEPVTLSHRRIFILPTQRGLLFMLFIGLLVLLAFVYNNNLAYLLAFLMAGVFVVSILHSFKALAGLKVSAGKNPAVYAGEAAAFAIRINNPTQYQRLNLHIIAQDSALIQIDIAAEQVKTLALMLPTNRRGLKGLGTVTFFSYFPLGLVRAWSPINFQSQVLVYPKPADSLLPLPETYSPKNQQGQKQTGSDDFYQCQTYQAGDPIRQIHWRAYAKQQGLLSKQFSGASSVETWLELNITPGQTLEDKLSQLCRWINDASAAGVDYGLRLPGVNYSPKHNSSHKHQCLEALALFKV